MKENAYALLRTLSELSAGFGLIITMGTIETPEKYDKFQYKSPKKTEKAEADIISRQDEKNKSTIGTAAMVAGMIGLILTEKKER